MVTFHKKGSAMKTSCKERIALFTQYFLSHDEPITVKQLQRMAEHYCGEKPKRQTVYDDLNAIDIVIGLKREHLPDQVGRTFQWSKLKILMLSTNS